MSQRQFWEFEYRRANFASTLRDEPSRVVKFFVEYLKKSKKPLTGRILELGCGNGRNAIYLAKLGFKVWAVDFVDFALNVTKNKTVKAGLISKIDIEKVDISKPLPYPAHYFDFVFDVLASNSLNRGERILVKKEIFRVLKKDGEFLLGAIDKEAEKIKLYLKNFPGVEPGTLVHPEVGYREKAFNKAEIIKFYDSFKLKKFKRITFADKFYGEKVKNSLLACIFTK